MRTTEFLRRRGWLRSVTGGTGAYFGSSLRRAVKSAAPQVKGGTVAV
jgi:hypothetical protein